MTPLRSAKKRRGRKQRVREAGDEEEQLSLHHMDHGEDDAVLAEDEHDEEEATVIDADEIDAVEEEEEAPASLATRNGLD